MYIIAPNKHKTQSVLNVSKYPIKFSIYPQARATRGRSFNFKLTHPSNNKSSPTDLVVPTKFFTHTRQKRVRETERDRK